MFLLGLLKLGENHLPQAIQRVSELGEPRFYQFVMDKVVVIKDPYDRANSANKQNRQGPHRPLAAKSKRPAITLERIPSHRTTRTFMWGRSS